MSKKRKKQRKNEVGVGTRTSDPVTTGSKYGTDPEPAESLHSRKSTTDLDLPKGRNGDSESSISEKSEWQKIWLGGLIIVVAGFIAYSNSFSCPFIFDDMPMVVENPTVRELSVRDVPLFSGRPLVIFSRMLNYAISGLDVWSYHLFNLLVHLSAGLVLYGVIRRTLLTGKLREHLERYSFQVAFLSALIWVVHPLQTESVTYLTQRSESMMGLFYLLTLYLFVLGSTTTDRPHIRIGMFVGSGIAAVCGFLCKEAMVSAIVIIVAFDRIFLANSFRDMFRRRWGYYGFLILLWGIPGIVLGIGRKYIISAFTDNVISPVNYLWTQGEVILMYMRLSIWPDSLCLDYVWPIKSFGEVWLSVVFLGMILLAGIWALFKYPPIGFLGVWFFVNLAPRSSLLPRYDAMVEHRMYLPLAAFIVLFVVVAGRGVIYLLDTFSNDIKARERSINICFVATALLIGSLLIFATFQRNKDYRSEYSIWYDTVKKSPENHRANNNLGFMLSKQGRFSDAAEYYQKALELKPGDMMAYYNLGRTLSELKRYREAIINYENAIKIKPDYVKAHYNLGVAYAALNNIDKALFSYKEAIRLQPDHAKALNNMGRLLARAGRFKEATGYFRESLRVDSDNAVAHNNLGNVLTGENEFPEAKEQLMAAIRLNPDYPEAYNNLGNLMVKQQKYPEALRYYQNAVRLDPSSAIIHNNLSYTLLKLGKLHEAEIHCREALRLRPNFPVARKNLQNILARK